jgi:hypothetical protein
VRVAGQSVDTDQRRLTLTAGIQVVQLDGAGGLKLVFGHRAKTPRGDAALRGFLQFVLESQNFATAKVGTKISFAKISFAEVCFAEVCFE